MTTDALIPSRADQPADILLVEVASGDHKSFSRLYDATSSRVYGLVRKVLVDVAQSEEVTQEVFLEVWQLAYRFDPARGSATSWMLTIAHKRAIDRVRASQSSRSRDRKFGTREYFELVDDVANRVEITLEHERAKRALICLTPLQREALTLCYWEGLTVAEIAVRLGSTRGAITTRIRDGLLKLRREMEQA